MMHSVPLSIVKHVTIVIKMHAYSRVKTGKAQTNNKLCLEKAMPYTLFLPPKYFVYLHVYYVRIYIYMLKVKTMYRHHVKTGVYATLQ